MKRILIKFGGAAMKNPAAADALFERIATLQKVGHSVVLVHGGGPEIDQLTKRLSLEVKKIDGLRVTDEATLEVVQLVLPGKVNKTLVTSAQLAGIRAVGLSALDAGMIVAKIKDSRLGYVGEVTSTNIELLTTLLQANFFPIICSLGQSATGQHLNLNADELAANLAGALRVDLFILITDVIGLMSNYPDPTSLIPQLTLAEVQELKASSAISAGMLPKVDACLQSLQLGAKSSMISDGLNDDILRFITEQTNLTVKSNLPLGTFFQ